MSAVHESFPSMYDGQVIPWTQRKCQAENLVGGGLRVVGQGESSSDQQDKHPNLAHSYPSSRQPNPVVPSGMFYLPVTPPPTLIFASSEATNRVRSRQLRILWDDQAHLATGSVRFEGSSAVACCPPPHHFIHSLPHYLRCWFAAPVHYPLFLTY